MANEDIYITIGANSGALQQALAYAEQSIQSFTARAGAQIKTVQRSFTEFVQPINSISTALQDSLARQQGFFSTIQKEAGKTAPKVVTGQTLINNAVKRTNVQLSKQAKQLKKSQREFQGWALSLLFFGQALLRISQSIARFGASKFQEISHSVEGTTTGFDELQNSMTYLGFVIGQALEPLAYILADLVMRVAEWLTNTDNQALFRNWILAAAAIGAVLIVLGTVVLAAFGFLGLMDKIVGIMKLFILPASLSTGLVNLGGVLSKVYLGVEKLVFGFLNFFTKGRIGVASFAGVWKAFVLLLGGSTLVAIGVIIAAVIVLWKMWETNFANIRGFTEETFGILWDTIKGVIGDVVDIFQGLFKIVEAIFTGDFELLWAGFKQLAGGAIKAVIRIFVGFGIAVANVFIFVINGIKSLFLSIISLVLGYNGFLIEKVGDGLNWIIRQINKLLPKKFEIDFEFDFSDNILKDAAKKVQEINEASNIPVISRDTTAGIVDELTGAIDDWTGVKDDIDSAEPETQTVTDVPGPVNQVNTGDIIINQQPGESSDDVIDKLLARLNEVGG